MCGYLKMNPIIKEVCGVVAIKGVDSILTGNMSTINAVTRENFGEMFVDPEVETGVNIPI